MRELLHEAARLILRAAVLDVGDVNENAHALALLRMSLDSRKNRIPILIGKRIARRIVRRRIEDDEERLLFFEKRLHLRRESGGIEGEPLVEKLECLQEPPDVLTERVVRAPEPIGSEHGFADLRVVFDRVVDGARAARRRDGLDIAFRPMIAEDDVLHALKICRQTRDGRIGDDFGNRQLAQHLLDRRYAGELFILTKDRTQRGVRDLLCPMLLRRRRRRAARGENHVVQNLVFRMRCCHLRAHFI